MCVGIGAALVQTAPSTISVTWIRPHQRTLATALQMLANQLGVALGFFLGERCVTLMNCRARTPSLPSPLVKYNARR